MQRVLSSLCVRCAVQAGRGELGASHAVREVSKEANTSGAPDAECPAQLHPL